MKRGWLLAMIVAVAGCGHTARMEGPITPITYSDPGFRNSASLGKLRRLAIMPVELVPYEGQFGTPEEHAEAARKYAAACESFLSERKGYETVTVFEHEGEWTGDARLKLERQEGGDLRARWIAENTDKHSEEVIRQIGRGLGTDGVLAIRIVEWKPWNTADALRNLALLNGPLFRRLATPNVGAWLYETSTGRLVYAVERSTGPDPESGVTDPEDIHVLFLEMENALPRQLTE